MKPLQAIFSASLLLIALFLTSISFAASVDDLTFQPIFSESNEDEAIAYRLVYCDRSAEGVLVIPEYFESEFHGRLPVTEIGEQAFATCNLLTDITIPGSVTTLGRISFINCSALTSLVIPDSVTAIGSSAFSDCSSLSSVSLSSSLTVIEDNLFFNCTSLASLSIPSGVTAIENDAFNNCQALTSISLPDTLISIGDRAFSQCQSLEAIIIPNSVTSIGESLFTQCHALKSVRLSNAVTSIGRLTFAVCYSLESLTIPSSVTAIGDEAFNASTSMESLYFEGSPPSIGTDVFLNVNPEILTVYVQAEYLAGYQALNLGYSLATYVPEQADGIYYTISSSFDRQNNQFIIVSEAEDTSLNTQVQYTEDLSGGSGTWTTLSNLAYIQATNTADNTITRTITNVDPSVNAERFYRLVSQP